MNTSLGWPYLPSRNVGAVTGFPGVSKTGSMKLQGAGRRAQGRTARRVHDCMLQPAAS